MTKWNITISGDLLAPNSEAAKKKLLVLMEALDEGKDVNQMLGDEETFDFTASVTCYGE